MIPSLSPLVPVLCPSCRKPTPWNPDRRSGSAASSPRGLAIRFLCMLSQNVASGCNNWAVFFTNKNAGGDVSPHFPSGSATGTKQCRGPCGHGRWLLFQAVRPLKATVTLRDQVRPPVYFAWVALSYLRGYLLIQNYTSNLASRQRSWNQSAWLTADALERPVLHHHEISRVFRLSSCHRPPS